MSITFGSVSKNTAQFITGANPSVALSGFNPNAGDTVVVFATWDSANTANATCRDNVDGMYVAAPGYVTNAPGSSQCAAVFYLKGSLCTGGTRTITITFTGGTADFSAIFAIPLSGAIGDIDVNGVPSLGNLQTAPGTGTDATVTPTVANTIKPAGIVAFSIDLSTTAPPTTGTGFTSNDSDATVCTRLETLRVTTAASQTATFTAGSNSSHISIIVVFDEIPAPDPKYRRPTSMSYTHTLDPGDGDFPAELTLKRWF